MTVKVKKKRVYSAFTHRFSWGGSRKLAIFKIELFLIIVNNVRCSLKIWQGSWIHFRFSLPFTASYVIQFILFYFERTVKHKPYRHLWILCQGVFWMCWCNRAKTFHNITVFKIYAKNITWLWSHGSCFQVLERIFETIK